MSRRQNNEYLREMWIVVAAVVGLVLVSTIALIFADAASVPLIGTGAGIALALGVMWWSRRRIERAFLRPDPEAIVKMMRPTGMGAAMPNAAAWSAFFEAWAYTLYGRFELARSALGSVDWSREPPIVAAAASSVEAQLCYLATREYARGLAIARTARARADMSESFPGAKTALASYDLLVEVGRVLTDASTEETISKLREYRETLPFGARLMAYWGLAVACSWAGDEVGAQANLDRCRELAPYCDPLHFVPELDAEEHRVPSEDS